MKHRNINKISIYFALVFTAILFSQCGPTIQDAINYNKKIIADQFLVINDINKLEEEFKTYNPEKIEPALEQAKLQVAKAISNLKQIGGFNEKTDFYDATMKLYKLFESQLNNEYAEQLEIYKLSDQEYTNEKRKRYNELLEKISKDYNVVNELFIKAQQNFAKEWNIILE